MKIALFHNLPSGGALKLAIQSARLFAERGHDVHVFSFSSADHDFAPLPDGIGRTILPLSFSGPGRFGDYRRATAVLAGLIRDWTPDAVWVEKCRFVGHPPILNALRELGLATVLYTHEPLRIRAHEALAPAITRREGEDAPLPVGSPLTPLVLAKKLFGLPGHFRRRALDRAAVRAAGQVFTSSNFTAKWLAAVYGARAGVLSPGVDVGFLTPDPNVQRGRRVLSVGRLAEVKGYDFVVSALGMIPETARPAWDIVVDDVDPVFAARFATEAARRGVRYTLHERITETQLRALYRSTGAVLCAAVREPFGLVPVEAMACGAPVIAVREGGFAETVVDGVTGHLLPRTLGRWAEATQALLDDPARGAQLGAAGGGAGARQVERRRVVPAGARRDRPRPLTTVPATFTA